MSTERPPSDTTNTAAHATRVVLRPIATPVPLGFTALATASLLTAGLELDWFSSSDRVTVALVLIAFAFPLQMLASIFGFLARDTAMATGFGVQGATWLVVGISTLSSAPGQTSNALGTLLFASAAWIALTATGSASGKLVPAATLTVTSARFLLTGLYEVTGSTGLKHAAAIVGLALVAIAAYAALALEEEGVHRHAVLPILRRGRGKRAATEDLAANTTDVGHEPGVRDQL